MADLLYVASYYLHREAAKHPEENRPFAVGWSREPGVALERAQEIARENPVYLVQVELVPKGRWIERLIELGVKDPKDWPEGCEDEILRLAQ